jgi:hypothetical protein
MSNFTLEDLVQYLYKETSELKIAAIKAALKTDWKLREAFNQLKSGQENLEEIEISPREESVNKILQHITKKQGQLFSH